MILASANEMTINKLAEMADRIMDAATLTITAVSTSTEDDRIRKILCEENNMALLAHHRSRPQSFSNSYRRGRNRSRRRSTSRGRSPNRQANRDNVYWYHVQFGENA